MYIEKLNQWLMLIANVGVLVGIFFLAYELRQNTQMMKSQTRAQVSQAVIENIAMSREPAMLKALLKQESGDRLSREDELLLDNAANATFRMWENNFYQYRAGLFEESEFDAERAIWIDIMSSDEIFQSHWRNRRTTYSTQFRDFMDELVAGLDP